jgi:hypothetical protein
MSKLSLLFATTVTAVACGMSAAQAVDPDRAAVADARGGKGSCNLHVSKAFGEACYAAVSSKLAAGGSAQFPNTRPGYRGSITASCSNGAVTWGESSCSPLAQPAAKATLAGTSTARSAAAPGDAGSYRIGTYYFPGWKDNQLGNPRRRPWEPLQLYVDREPLLGWYAEDSPGVMDQQLKWMRDYGLDYVVFDFLWSGDNRPLLTAGIDAYLGANDRHGVQFSLIWTNHTTFKFTKAQFQTLFTFWATRYFKHRDYVKVDGKPLVFIFSADTLDANAKAIGMTTPELVAMADDIVKPMGLPGVSFIGASTGSRYKFAGSGYQGFSAYNYHSPASAPLTPARPENLARSYVELDDSYQDQWAWMRNKAHGLYVLPMTSGWDKRPWGGSKDPKHDDSRSTPAEFRNHLLAARKFLDSNPELTRRMGVICCWNEFGEGSFIEPTKVDGMKYLEQVRDVFGGK